MKKFQFIIISFLIGAICGMITFLFGIVLNNITTHTFNLYPYNLILLPFTITLITYILNKNSKIHQSMLQIFNATQDSTVLNLLIAPFLIVTTWLSHLAGASVGREGVAVQLGGVCANQISTLFKNLNLDKKLLTAIGMGSGFAGLFGTPLAGLFFSFELTRQKANNWTFWIMGTIACFMSSITSNILGLKHFHQHIKIDYTNISLYSTIIIFISIFLFILTGMLFVILLKKFKLIYHNIKINNYIKGIIFSILLAVIMIITNGRYMSLGTNLIDLSFNQLNLVSYLDFIFKLLITVFTLSIGFQGGEVTPIFAIGATLGATIGNITHVNAYLLAAIGYATVFGNSTRAYLCSFFICVEIFGLSTIPIMLISLLISKFINLKFSIYPIF